MVSRVPRGRSPLHRFLRKHRRDLIDGTTGPIVVVADSSSAEVVDSWNRTAPGRVHVLSDVRPESDGVIWHESTPKLGAYRLVESIGDIAVIVDATTTGVLQRVINWEWLFFHVKIGGYYVSAEGARESGWVVATRLVGRQHRSDRELDALRMAMRQQISFEGYTILPKVQQHVWKTREESATADLRARHPELSVQELDVMAGGEESSELVIVQHGSDQSVPATTFAYPSATLRFYKGDVLIGSHLLTTVSNTALPSSFRHARMENLSNMRLDNVNRDFASAKVEELDGGERPGSFYDLNAGIPGHFGHTMMESVAKLWGWDAAKSRNPDLKAYYRVPSAEFDTSLVTRLFSAFGISDSDIHFASQNERVDNLISPSLLWHNAVPYHFHPAVTTVWDRLRDDLARQDEHSPRRLFVSRGPTASSRVCRNGPDVEKFFEERGFTVVHPELLSLEDQATLFFNADDIAGFAGAAMFNLIFAGRRPRVTVLSHESYTARNEQLIASSVARELHYFWSRADLAQPKSRYSAEAFLSDWEFDFARNGIELDGLLRGPGPAETEKR